MPGIKGSKQSEEQQETLDRLKAGSGATKSQVSDDAAVEKKPAPPANPISFSSPPRAPAQVPTPLRGSVDEIVAVWFKETREDTPDMAKQHPMDWVQSQLPKLVTALTR